MTALPHDLGVKGDILLEWAKDNALIKKNAKTFVKRKEQGIKEIILDRNNTTWVSNIFALARAVYEVAKYRFSKITKFSRIPEATKFIGLATTPFAMVGIYDNLKPLVAKGFTNVEKGIDRVLDIVSDTGSVIEGAGLVGEGFISFIPTLSKFSPITSAFGAIATVVGLISLVIDVKGIFRTAQAIQDVDTQKPGEIKINDATKNAFKERFSWKIGSHVVNIVATLVCAAAFAIFMFAPATLIVASAVLLAAGLTITIARMIMDAYADQLIVERLKQATT